MELLTDFFLHPIETLQVATIFDGKTKIYTPRYFDSKNCGFVHVIVATIITKHANKFR